MKIEGGGRFRSYWTYETDYPALYRLAGAFLSLVFMLAPLALFVALRLQPDQLVTAVTGYVVEPLVLGLGIVGVMIAWMVAATRWGAIIVFRIYRSRHPEVKLPEELENL